MKTARAKKSKPQPASHFFSLMKKLDDGRKIPTDIDGSRKAATKHTFIDKRDGVQKFPFVPLKDKRRFRIATFSVYDWQPKHVLDVCRGKEIGCEMWAEDSDLFDRARGFAQMADENRTGFPDAKEPPGEYKHLFWAVLVEFGEPLPTPLVNIEIDEAGVIGCETRWLKFPARVVIPTAEEIAKFT